jgi:hypothetical protein
VGRSALLVNLASNSVEEKPQMTQGRRYHSVAVVGNMTYVIAGYDTSTCRSVTSVERFDVISERWSTLTAKFDQFGGFTSSITCNSRYILTFGGMTGYPFKLSSSTLVRRFDHLKPMGAWVTMRLDSNKPCLNSYGLMSLGRTSAPEEANNNLLFGGYKWCEKDDSMAV